ncbi:MAG: ABC transporter permease, partial [Candidatus Cryosericum sp.]
MSDIVMGPARRRGRKIGRTLLSEVVPFAFGLAVWQLLSWLNIWPRVLFPSPNEVFWAFFADLSSGALLRDLGVSMVSLGLGFLVGAVAAVPLGYLMGLNRASRDFFDPLINLFQAIPGLAWIPFAILWFGLGQGAVTFIIVMAVFFPVLHNLLTGIR